MPEFKEHEEEPEHRKRAMLAPALEQAMQRKQAMPPLADEAIPTVEAYGFAIAQTDEGTLDEGTRQRLEHLRRIAEGGPPYLKGRVRGAQGWRRRKHGEGGRESGGLYQCAAPNLAVRRGASRGHVSL